MQDQFNLTVTQLPDGDPSPTLVRIWFKSGEDPGEEKTQLSIEITGEADLVTELHNDVLGSRVVQSLIRDSGISQDEILSKLQEAERRVKEGAL